MSSVASALIPPPPSTIFCPTSGAFRADGGLGPTLPRTSRSPARRDIGGRTVTAQRTDVIPELRQLLKEKGGESDLEDIRAALDALDNRNPNYYVDRDHSGNGDN